jgi:hypothetical protein
MDLGVAGQMDKFRLECGGRSGVLGARPTYGGKRWDQGLENFTNKKDSKGAKLVRKDNGAKA